MAVTRTTLLFVVLTCALVGKLLALGATLDTASHPQQRSVLPATLALLGFLFAPLPWLRPSVRAAAFFAIDLLITTLAVADAIHFRVLGDVVSIAELTHASQLGFVMPSVASLLKPRDLLPFLDVAIGILLYAFWARRSDRRGSPATAAVEAVDRSAGGGAAALDRSDSIDEARPRRGLCLLNDAA